MKLKTGNEREEHHKLAKNCKRRRSGGGKKENIRCREREYVVERKRIGGGERGE